MHRLIFVGSPRANGRSGALADAIFDACIEDAPFDGVSVVSVAGMQISGCTGCGACKKTTYDAQEQINQNGSTEPSGQNNQNGFDPEDPLAPCALVQRSDAQSHKCVITDDMTEVRKHLDAADELIVVCPVYFGGAPSQAKSVLDRLQPYFWSDALTHTFERRPMTLHIVGEGAGNDPYGSEALVASVRSAFGVCGFKLECLFDWTGCIDANGEIMADAREVDLSTLKIHPVQEQYQLQPEYGLVADNNNQAANNNPDGKVNSGNQKNKTMTKSRHAAEPGAKNSRPKLDVHSGNKRSGVSGGAKVKDSSKAKGGSKGKGSSSSNNNAGKKGRK